MKGSDAPIFTVLRAFQEIGVKLKGDIIFESVIEEETGGAGSLACALRGYKADAAIISEPSNFKYAQPNKVLHGTELQFKERQLMGA